MTIVGSRIFALLVAISFFLCGLATQNAWSLDQHVRSLLEMQSQAPPWTCGITVCVVTGFPGMGVNAGLEKRCSGALGKWEASFVNELTFVWASLAGSIVRVTQFGFRYSVRQKYWSQMSKCQDMGTLKFHGRLTVGILEGGGIIITIQSSFYLQVIELLKMLETWVFIAMSMCIRSWSFCTESVGDRIENHCIFGLC